MASGAFSKGEEHSVTLGWAVGGGAPGKDDDCAVNHRLGPGLGAQACLWCPRVGGLCSPLAPRRSFSRLCPWV